MATEKTDSKKEAARNLAIYAFGNVTRQLAGFIMLPIYTSYLTPADYGVVGLLVVMVSLFEALIGARFAQAVPKFYYEQKDEQSRRRIISTALIITATISAVSTGMVALASPWIAEVLFGTRDLQLEVALYGTMLFTTAVEIYGLTFIRLQERTVLFVTNSILKLICQLSLNVLFVVYYELGVMGVVLSAAISSCLFGLFSACYIMWYNGLGVSRSITRELVLFCWPLWLAGIAGLYIGSSNRVFIKIFADLDQVGLFELAHKFALVLTMLIWNPFTQWWQAEQFKIYHRSDQGKTTFPAIFNLLLAVLVLVGSTICLFGDSVISIMSAPEFFAASYAIPFLVGAAIFGYLNQFMLLSFMVSERTIIIAYIRYGAAVIITAFYFLLIPTWGYVGAAASLMASQILIFVLTFLLAKRSFDLGIRLRFMVYLMSGAGLVILTDFAFFLDLENIWEEMAMSALANLVIVLFVLFLLLRDPLLKDFVSSGLRLVKEKVAWGQGGCSRR